MLMQNPQLMQQLMNPETINAMMHLQQVMGNMNQPPASQPMTSPAGGPANYANMMAALQNNPMLAQMLAAGAGGAAAAMPLPPAALAEFEQRYASEISQLEAMGFTDRAANIEALRVCDGNVELAINYLFDLGSN
jgi:ubiquilin